MLSGRWTLTRPSHGPSRKPRARPSLDSRQSRRASSTQNKGYIMRFGNWRALMLAFSLAFAVGVGFGPAKPAQAGWPDCTIPRLSPAYDFTKGGEYMAPPVPYGHYAKDYVGSAQKHLAGVSGHLHGLLGSLHHGEGDGNGCGHKGCGGNGCGGAFGHDGGSDCGVAGCFGGMSCGLLGHRKHGGAGSVVDWDGGAAGYATTTGGPSAQSLPIPSSQSACGQPGCNIGGRHAHLGQVGGNSGCGVCGGGGCGSCRGIGNGDGGCSFCGGKGCGHCLGGKGGGLGSMVHGKLASLVSGLHHPKMKWFVGPGGPVPLTPGYVPYIVTTRSPRDFFAFPPMNPDAR